MTQKRKPSNVEYSRLIGEGYDLLRSGDLERALAAFKKARDHARRRKNTELANRAASSISACYVEMGEYEKASRGLREIILRSTDDETICAAAYNLSISLRRQGSYPKAFIYAQKAVEKARGLRDLNWMARCHNLIGNIYLVQSHMGKALTQYRKALGLRLKEEKVNEFSVAILKDNIGYCQMLQGKYARGIQSVKEALDLVTTLGSKKCICECSHDLSFGYMQLRELDKAKEYGLRALELAESEGYNDIIKNCYYLLGEINYLKGDQEMRDYYFYRLQELYPNLPYLRDFLCTFDVSKIIALRFPQ